MQRPSFLKRGGTLLFYLLLFLFFAAPVLRLISMSLRVPGGWGLTNFQVLFQDSRTLEAIRNTLFISLCSAGLSTLLGTALGFLLAYTDLRHKKLLELLILLPFIIPSYIITLSWSGLFLQDGRINLFLRGLGFAGVNLYTRGGILFVLGIVNMPVVYLSVIHFLRKIPVDLDLAARSCGFSSWETWRRIDLKEALPAIAAGGLLAFLAAMDNFAVPAFLGISSNITVLSTMIYEKAIGMGPGAFPAAAGLSVVLSCLALGGTLLESGLVSSQSALESIQESREPRIFFRPSVRTGVEGGLFLVLGLLDLVPLLDMMINAFLKNYGLPATADNFSWENFQFVFSSTGVMDALETSLLLASAAGAICLVAGTLIAYWKLRRHSVAALLAERGAALAYALPGIVLALAEIFHWTEPLPGIKPGIYGTMGLLLIAYVTRYMILQIKGSTNALLAINPELEDAVLASGRDWRTLWRQVLLPLLLRPCVASTALIFISALTELTLSSMLASAGTRTIGLAIFNFQQAGDYNLAAALSTLITALILGGYGLTWLENLHKKGNRKYEFVSGTHQSAVREDTGA